MSSRTILYEKADGVGTVTLNRPDKLNALNLEMLQALWEVLQESLKDDAVRVILLTGRGRYFSAGADLEILSTMTPATFRSNQHRYWLRVFNEIENTPKLTIAALNGPAIGGAVELALCCDLRYAAESVTLRLPQIDFGILPDAGATLRLPQLIGLARAKELILSGDPVDAGLAAQVGLVSRVFPVGRFEEEVGAIARKMARKPPLAVSMGKQLINDAARKGDLHASLHASTDAQCFLITTEDYREGVRAFFEKREPVFRGR